MTEEPDDTGDGEAVYGLVMPYVVVTSVGGPYDDKSFVAGARMADIQNALNSGKVEHESYEPPGLVPQLDLIAMDKGYRMTTEVYSEEWTLVTFVRIAA